MQQSGCQKVWKIAFSIASNLKKHQKTHILDSDFNDYYENAKNSGFTDNFCAKCEEKFDNLMDLVVHFNQKHDRACRVNNRPQCPVCLKSCKQMGHLKYHVNVTHLKRFHGTMKKRPPKTIGTVVCKIYHQFGFIRVRGLI